MPVILTSPLRWQAANPDEQAVLDDLQANVLKGHGREHTSNLFFKFDPASPGAARAFLRAVADQVTTAQEQLSENKTFKATGKSGGLVTLVYLSAAGYQALGAAAKAPTDPSFLAGMKSRQGTLNDPPVAKWDRHFREQIHAMVLLADTTAAKVKKARKALLAGTPAGVVLVGEETGLAWRSKLAPGEGIEHFGYVDGRSQPLMLVEDIEKARDLRDGTTIWDPAFPLQQVLVSDPAGNPGASFGSYFVFRKLDQDVRGFKKAEEALAKALGLQGDDEERAGAMIVGRFEDGTPVVMQRADGVHNPVPNNFDYRVDPTGAKCPMHGHIRKTNPRGESVKLGATLEQERARTMARRGITYGVRKKHPNSKKLTLSQMPTKNVGLFFMVYQADIGNQFEFTQASWANNPNFVDPQTGIDPVIGQGGAGGQRCPVGWGGTAVSPRKAFDFRGFVTHQGGRVLFCAVDFGLEESLVEAARGG